MTKERVTELVVSPLLGERERERQSTNLILSEAVVPCYVLRRVPTGPGGVALGADAGSNSVLTLSLCVCVSVCVCVCLCVCVRDALIRWMDG